MLQALFDPALLYVLRDPRGGLASTLNEITRQSQVGTALRCAWRFLAVQFQVVAACELAGTGSAVRGQRGQADRHLRASRLPSPCWPPCAHTRWARVRSAIGTVIEDANGFAQMDTRLGGRRVVDWLSGEQFRASATEVKHP